MDNKYEDALLQLMDELLLLLKKYETQTDQMVSADLEIIQDVLISRNDTIEKMKLVREKMSSIIDSSFSDSNIKDILAGRIIDDKKLTSYEKYILQKMRALHITQQSIIGKDFKITHRVQENYNNIRKELEQLKQDKKKIDYYSSAAGSIKGSSFDSSM